jgi:DtxR family Mn-dependent transcriptional regulator
MVELSQTQPSRSLPENLSQCLEDYLEAIYIINQDKKVVRVKEIAQFLNVKTPSVVDAITKLTERGFVVHEKYGYLNLSEKGVSAGREIYKKHEEIYKFLNQVLGVDHKTAKKDACGIEHYISRKALDKIIKLVEFIETSPEGYPEWLKNFNYYVRYGKRLKNLVTNKI